MRPCMTEIYNLEQMDLNNFGKTPGIERVVMFVTTRSTHPDEDYADKHSFFITYIDHYDKHYRDYLLYNFEGILASVGGALGLFLGLSFFSTVGQIIDWLFQKWDLLP